MKTQKVSQYENRQRFNKTIEKIKKMKNGEKTLERLETLLGDVKTMNEEDFKGFLDKMVNFHNYSYLNRMVVMSQGGSQVAAGSFWKSKGRKIKDWKKKIWILAPIMKKFKKEVEENGKKQEKEISFISGFKWVYVFDISNTEGKALPENWTTKSNISKDRLVKAAESLGFTVSHEPLEYSKGGYIYDKNIVLNSNRNETAHCGTLVHEMAHGMLGHTSSKDDHSRSEREQQAETVTYLVCKELGIQRESEFYLKSWNLDEDILFKFEMINKAAQQIKTAIMPPSVAFMRD